MRLDVDHYRYIESVNENLDNLGLDCEELREYMTLSETGKPITRKDYANRPTSYIHLTVRNIQDGLMILDDPIYIREEKGRELEQFKIKKGDLILAISSNVGDCFIYDGSFKDIQFTLSHYLIKLRFNEEKLFPQFLVQYLNSNLMRDYFLACETGKTQMNLSKEYIYEIPFPIMDLEEQHSIAESINVINRELKEKKSELLHSIQKRDERFLRYINRDK